MKITKQYRDEKTIVKIAANQKEEVIQNFWSFLNRGAVPYLREKDNLFDPISDDYGLQWINEDGPEYSAYFYSNDKMLLEALQSRHLFIKLNKIDPNFNLETIPEKLIEEANILGQNEFDSMEFENIFREREYMALTES